jgi:hypothetical protein
LWYWQVEQTILVTLARSRWSKISVSRSIQSLVLFAVFTGGFLRDFFNKKRLLRLAKTSGAGATIVSWVMSLNPSLIDYQTGFTVFELLVFFGSRSWGSIQDPDLIIKTVSRRRVDEDRMRYCEF